MHQKPTNKRPSILTPLPNPSKRAKPSSILALLNSEGAVDESLLSMTLDEVAENETPVPAKLTPITNDLACPTCPFATKNEEELVKHKGVCSKPCQLYMRKL